MLPFGHKEANMDNTTLLIIIIVVVIFSVAVGTAGNAGFRPI